MASEMQRWRWIGLLQERMLLPSLLAAQPLPIRAILE